MADKDFEIKVRTTADTSGIKETEAGLDRIARKETAEAARRARESDAAAAKWRASPLNPANAPVTGGGIGALGGAGAAAAPGAGVGGAGLFGGLAAGAVAGAVTAAISAIISGVQKLNEELDKQADTAIKTMERVRELQEAFRESVEWAEKLRGIRKLPLTEEIQALQFQLIRLRTEQSLVNQSTEDGVKAAAKYQQQIDAVTNSLEQATEKQKKLKEQAFVEEPAFVTRAFKAADPQVKALLEARIAAQRAQERGEYFAPVYTREAEEAILRFRRVATPEQRAEIEQLAPHLADILNELKKQTAQWQ